MWSDGLQFIGSAFSIKVQVPKKDIEGISVCATFLGNESRILARWTRTNATLESVETLRWGLASDFALSKMYVGILKAAWLEQEPIAFK